jgi:hypothetical protein
MDGGWIPVFVAQGLRSSWRGRRDISRSTGTAVTRLAKAGCTEAEISTLTGHTLRDVRTLLDSNYLQGDPTLAERAIRKLERGTKTPD